MAAIACVELIFPLHHHAEVLVVQNDRLGRDLLDVRGRQLLHVHQERAIAIDIDHLLVRTRHFCAKRRRIAVAHRAEPGAGQELARERVSVILRRPHLMLAHAGRNDRFAFGQFVQQLDHHLRQDHFAFLARGDDRACVATS